jgi:hypothetical protein
VDILRRNRSVLTLTFGPGVRMTEGTDAELDSIYKLA